MDQKLVQQTIADVISDMEVKLGHAPIKLGADDVPENECEEFDSKVWQIAVGRIGRKLGIIIPKGTAVFGRRNGAEMTVAASAKAICKKYELRPSLLVAAE